MDAMSTDYCCSLLDAAVDEIRDEDYDRAIRNVQEIRQFLTDIKR